MSHFICLTNHALTPVVDEFRKCIVQFSSVWSLEKPRAENVHKDIGYKEEACPKVNGERERYHQHEKGSTPLHMFQADPKTQLISRDA